jgi:hypothetical protein
LAAAKRGDPLSPFAEGTTVPASKTRAEIEDYVRKRGATRFACGYLEDRAGISFVANGLMIPMPKEDEKPIRARALRLSRSSWRIDPPKLQVAIDEEDRRRWRCLLLAIKSKFTTVESGIESFEEAFLANIVTTDNLTVYERIKLEDSGIRMLPPVSP